MDIVVCVCGIRCRKDHIRRHMRSIKHVKFTGIQADEPHVRRWQKKPIINEPKINEPNNTLKVDIM